MRYLYILFLVAVITSGCVTFGGEKPGTNRTLNGSISGDADGSVNESSQDMDGNRVPEAPVGESSGGVRRSSNSTIDRTPKPDGEVDASSGTENESSSSRSPRIYFPSSGNVSVEVEIADNRTERARGLMFRNSLPRNHGMLFVFPGTARRSFWMKNTFVPLDIVFIDAENRVLNVRHASPGRGPPYKRYRSKGEARYVLEVNRGFANRTNVTKGDKVIMDVNSNHTRLPIG